MVAKAIKAHGGLEGLTKAATAARAGKGVLLVRGLDLNFTTDEVLNLPNQLRVRLEVNKTQLMRVLNGDKGWEQSAGGMTLEMTRDRLAEARDEAYVWWLVTLAPLLKDGFDLDVLPEIKVDGRAAVGVKVASRGRPDAACTSTRNRACSPRSPAAPGDRRRCGQGILLQRLQGGGRRESARQGGRPPQRPEVLRGAVQRVQVPGQARRKRFTRP